MWCGISAAGEVLCRQPEGGTEALPGVPPFTGLAVTRGAACAVDAEGTLACHAFDRDAAWVHPGLAQLAGQRGVTSVALSDDALCVILDAQEIRCAGTGPAVRDAP